MNELDKTQLSFEHRGLKDAKFVLICLKQIKYKGESKRAKDVQSLVTALKLSSDGRTVVDQASRMLYSNKSTGDGGKMQFEVTEIFRSETSDALEGENKNCCIVCLSEVK